MGLFCKIKERPVNLGICQWIWEKKFRSYRMENKILGRWFHVDWACKCNCYVSFSKFALLLFLCVEPCLLFQKIAFQILSLGQMGGEIIGIITLNLNVWSLKIKILFSCKQPGHDSLLPKACTQWLGYFFFNCAYKAVLIPADCLNYSLQLPQQDFSEVVLPLPPS